MDSNHNQTWVKVNAQVDEGVAELVEALNMFPELWTTKSSQGDSQSPAWVYFSYGSGHWQEVAKFTLGHLGPRLAQQLGDQARLSICMTPSGKAQGELLVRPGALKECVEVMRALSSVDPAAFAGSKGSSSTPMSPPAATPTSTVDMVDPPIPSQ